ncbi:MAG: DUF5686 and carboxypeptidase regulatory-like domain-containing protein [Bacteroidota bacterium]
MIRFYQQSLLCLLLVLNSSGFAIAGKVSGKIQDEDGLPLAFASVLIKGTSLGTSANADGFYTLNLPEGKYILQAQYIGYKQTEFSLNLSANESAQHNFTLIVQGYELKDIVIKSGGEDPAYRIIRNAIKKRSFYLKQMQSFQSEIYLKGVLRNRKMPDNIMGIKIKEENKKDMNGSMGLDSSGKGVLYLAEQIADYYTSGNKNKLIIRSVKESGDPNGVGMGSVPPVINFYENNVNVLLGSGANDLGFVSPISNSALNSYTYKLMGEFRENDRLIYKIKVTPKRNFERCFTGDIYIADEDWAIHSVQFLLTQKQGLDMLDTLKTEQVYIPLGKDFWVIKNQVFYPTLNLFGFDISGNFVTVYDNQKVNQPIPDSIFNKKVTITYQRDATKRDSTYWQSLRPVALEADELKNYDYKDSIHKVDTDPKRIDSLRKRANKVRVSEIFLDGLSFNSKEYKRRFAVSGIVYDLNFNTVEGLNYAPTISFRQRIDTGKIFSAETQLRYGFSNTHFNAKGLLRYTENNKSWSGRNWSAALAGGKYISQLNNEQPVGELVNSYVSLVQQLNYFKIFERWIAGVQIKRNFGNGFSWNASLQYEDRIPLQNTTNYSFVQNKNIQAYSDNLPIEFAPAPMLRHQAMIAAVHISFQPGVHYTQYPERKVPQGSKAPVFSIQYQKGIPNLLNSDVDFDKWHFKIQDEVNIKRLGSFEYNAIVGGFLNDKNVQIPDMKHLLGNSYNLATPFLRSFQLAPYYRYSNVAKIYGEFHIEYYLKGLISNKIPLFRQAHWYFVLGNNSFYVDQKQYYTEAFVGVDNIGYKIFRGIRCDFIKSWDSYKQSTMGIRVGFKLGSAIRVNEQDKASIF